MSARHPQRSLSRAVRRRKPVHPGRESDELDAMVWPEAGIRVRDCMTRSAVTVHADALVRGAVEMMRKRKIRHLPVVDRGDRLVGIVADRDLRHVLLDPRLQERIGEAARTLATLTVGEVMTWGVVTAHPDMDIRVAARQMREQRIGALPVVQGGRVVGMLTEADLLTAFQDVLARGVLAKPYKWAFAYR